MSRAEKTLCRVLPVGHAIMGRSRDHWRQLRRRYIGASEVAAILGVHPYMTPLSVWLSKVAGAEEPDNEAMVLGRLLEPAIVRNAAPNTYRWPQHRMVVTPWRGAATPDGVREEEGAVMLVEAKTTRHDVNDDEPPPWWIVQVHAQLAVTGAEHAIICALIAGRQLKTWHIDVDPKLLEALPLAVQRWWQRHVERRVPPEPVASADLRLVQSMFPTPKKGATVRLDEGLAAVTARILELEARIRELTEERDTLRARIAAAIGEAERGELPDGTAWEWKLVRRREYTVPASEFRRLTYKGAKR